jgi:hypothetical protein
MLPLHGDGRGAAWLALREGRRPRSRKAIKSDKLQNGRILYSVIARRVEPVLRASLSLTLHKKVLDETGIDGNIPTAVHTAEAS